MSSTTSSLKGFAGYNQRGQLVFYMDAESFPNNTTGTAFAFITNTPTSNFEEYSVPTLPLLKPKNQPFYRKLNPKKKNW